MHQDAANGSTPFVALCVDAEVHDVWNASLSRCPRSGTARAIVAIGMLVLGFTPAPAREVAALADKAAIDPASLPAPRRVVVPRVRAAVTIDGEFHETVWTKAARLGPFVPGSGSGRAREATVVRVWYNDTALYLGWTCTDSDIQATFTARDSKFWKEEVVELFITPRNPGRYFELQWNPLGGVFDAIIHNTLDELGVSKKFEGDWNYTTKGMKSAVKVRGTVANASDRDKSWQVEVEIPFADFGEAAPKPQDVWRANFYRFNRAKDQPVEALSWSAPVLPGFHQPSRFGFLEFGP